MRNKTPEKMEYTDTIVKFGTGAHIVLPKSVIGKKVKVTIEFLDSFPID